MAAAFHKMIYIQDRMGKKKKINKKEYENIRKDFSIWASTQKFALGLKRTQKNKDKIRETLLKKYNILKVKGINIFTGEIIFFSSLREAARNGFDRRSLKDALDKPRKDGTNRICKGYIWERI